MYCNGDMSYWRWFRIWDDYSVRTVLPIIHNVWMKWLQSESWCYKGIKRAHAHTHIHTHTCIWWFSHMHTCNRLQPARACAHAGETNMTILVDGTIDDNRNNYTQGWIEFKEQADDFIRWAVGNRTEVLVFNVWRKGKIAVGTARCDLTMECNSAKESDCVRKTSTMLFYSI